MTVSESTHISEVLHATLPRNEGQRSLENLLQELRDRESLENPDVIVPMKELRLTSDGRLAVPALHAEATFAFNDWSQRQLASIVGVRWDKWFSRMSGEEQAAEVNKRLWSSSESLKVRTLRLAPKANGTAGIVRALVSPTFSPLADSDLLGLMRAALEPVEPELRVVRSHMTERTTSIVLGVGRPFKPGDDHEVGDVWGGITIRNSGVGFASVAILACFHRLLCKNGMQAPVPGACLLKRAHRAFDLGKLRDVLVERLRELPGKLADAARVLVASRRREVPDAKAAFTEILRKAHLPLRILPDLEQAYEAEPRLRSTAFGISQAVTRAAQSMSSEERFLLEEAAGEYLERNVSRCPALTAVAEHAGVDRGGDPHGATRSGSFAARARPSSGTARPLFFA